MTPSALGGQLTGDAPRFERFHPGDFADWTPGRDMGLVYSTRLPIDVFKTGGGKRAAADLEIPFLGAIPIDPEIVEASDTGKPYVLEHPDSETAKVLGSIIEEVSKL